MNIIGRKVGPNAHQLAALAAQAAKMGEPGTRVVRKAIYGQRRPSGFTSANMAPPARTALPGQPHSVWQGPRSSFSGAPVLRRY